MKPKIRSLPMVLEFQDYHEIDDFAEKLSLVVSGVKVRELSLLNSGVYGALIYTGRLTDSANRAMIEKVQAESEGDN